MRPTSHFDVTLAMSQLLKKVSVFLLLLLDLETSDIQKRQLLAKASTNQTNAISEIIHNILKGVIPLNKKNITALARNKTQLRALGNRHTALRSRKQILKAHSKVVIKTLETTGKTLRQLLNTL